MCVVFKNLCFSCFGVFVFWCFCVFVELRSRHLLVSGQCTPKTQKHENTKTQIPLTFVRQKCT